MRVRACRWFLPIEDHPKPHNDSAFLLARALDENIALYSNYAYRSLYTARQDGRIVEIVCMVFTSSHSMNHDSQIHSMREREREKKRDVSYSSVPLIHPTLKKSPEIVWNMEVTFFLVHLTPVLALKTLNLCTWGPFEMDRQQTYRGVRFLCWKGARYVRMQGFALVQLMGSSSPTESNSSLEPWESESSNHFTLIKALLNPKWVALV